MIHRALRHTEQQLEVALQAAIGAIVVLTTSTLNRVMVVELALPALLPGLLLALQAGRLFNGKPTRASVSAAKALAREGFAVAVNGPVDDAELRAAVAEVSAIGPCVGSCGTAAYRGEAVLVSDIDSDPLWAPFRKLAAPHGLRASVDDNGGTVAAAADLGQRQAGLRGRAWRHRISFRYKRWHIILYFDCNCCRSCAQSAEFPRVNNLA